MTFAAGLLLGTILGTCLGALIVGAFGIAKSGDSASDAIRPGAASTRL
jgi:hypothetical protein